MEKIILTENDKVFIFDGGNGGIGCGSINDNSELYFIDTNN